MNASAPQEPGPAILHLWHPVAILQDLRPGETKRTQLLDREIAVGSGDAGASVAYRRWLGDLVVGYGLVPVAPLPSPPT